MRAIVKKIDTKFDYAQGECYLRMLPENVTSFTFIKATTGPKLGYCLGLF
jgi:hypothetical protein